MTSAPKLPRFRPSLTEPQLRTILKCLISSPASTQAEADILNGTIVVIDKMLVTASYEPHKAAYIPSQSTGLGISPASALSISSSTSPALKQEPTQDELDAYQKEFFASLDTDTDNNPAL